MLKNYMIMATMEIIIAIVITALSVSAHAEAWSTFTGYNELKQLITLSPDGWWWYPDRNEKSPQDKNVENLYSIVYVGTSKSQYKYEIKDICHRYFNSYPEGGIWCDGNKKSPLYGVTYRYIKTNKLCKQIWQCVSGCNSRAPKQMFYQIEYEPSVDEDDCKEHKDTDVKIREEILVRDRPDINGKIIGKYSANTRVKIIERNYNCMKYCFKDGTADGQWIKVKNLSDKSAVSGWIFDYFVEYSESP